MAKRFILALVLSALVFAPIAHSTGPRFLPVGDQPSDYFLEISKGNIAGHTLMAKFGEVLDLPNTGVFEDVWDAGGQYVPPTVPRVHNIDSSDVDDVGNVLSSGTATGGSLTTLIDTGATFSTDTVAIGDAILNDTNVEICAVTAVTETILTCAGSIRSPNSGLVGNPNESGDSYRIVTNGSTGASILHILGLDENFLEIEEFVILNGQSNVATSRGGVDGVYIRQFRARVFGPGTTAAEGTIESTAVTDGTVTLQILGSNNQTLMAIYTCPADKICYIIKWWGSMTRAVASATSDFHLRGGTLDGIGYLLQDRSFTTTGSSQFTFDYAVPIAIPGGSDIWVEANANANLVGVASGFDVIVVDN